jgi:dUTPase
MIRRAHLPATQPWNPIENQILNHVIWYKRDDETAIGPTTANIYSLGLTLHSPIDVIIPYNTMRIIDTKLKFIFPEGFHGLITSMDDDDNPSTVMTFSTIIQSDFATPNVHVRLFNSRDYDYQIKRGEDIGFLVLQKSYFYGLKQVPSEYAPLKKKPNLDLNEEVEDGSFKEKIETPTADNKISAEFDMKSHVITRPIKFSTANYNARGEYIPK